MENTEARFTVRHRDPVTGRSGMAVISGWSALQVAEHFAIGSLDAHRLASFAVEDDTSGYIRSAEQFLEDNPELAVVATWTAGSIAARAARQKTVEEYWPNLAMALNALEAAHEV